jgi:ComF family protein
LSQSAAARAQEGRQDGSVSLVAQLVAAVVPPTCAGCRGPLVSAEQVLCCGCRRALPWLRGPRCRRCGLPDPCRPCPARAAAFDAAWAPVAYAGPARELVVALKFRGAMALADLMAAQIAAAVPQGLLDGTTLVAVPLPAARRRRRGFDQAEAIARSLSHRLGVPLARCLARAGHASRQLGAGRRARLAPRRLEVVLTAPAPARAALVDDVHTTGATFDACARALRAAGCDRVVCLAYARAL